MGREAPNKQARGSKGYRDMIARGEREAAAKNLPFSFGKVTRAGKLSVRTECPTCGRESAVTRTTVMVGCPSCGCLYDVTEDNSSAF